MKTLLIRIHNLHGLTESALLLRIAALPHDTLTVLGMDRFGNLYQGDTLVEKVRARLTSLARAIAREALPMEIHTWNGIDFALVATADDTHLDDMAMLDASGILTTRQDDEIALVEALHTRMRAPGRVP